MAKDTQAALLRMIRDARQTADDGAITVKELCVLLGCRQEKARDMIRDLVAAGKMESCRSPRKQMTGMVVPTWAYRIVDQSLPTDRK